LTAGQGDAGIAMLSLGTIFRTASPDRRLAEDGVTVIRQFLGDQDASALQRVVAEIYRELAACAALPDGLEDNFRRWHGVWLEALPDFLRGRNGELQSRYAALVATIVERTRERLGSGWQLYLAKSFFRRHVGAALLIPWHIDADVAVLERERCINVWLPLDRVGAALPSLEVMRRSHLKMRSSPTLAGGVAAAAAFGKPFAPKLNPGDALVFDQFTLHRTQRNGAADIIRTSCEFRFYWDAGAHPA
jgi:phytanoyl-CoA dioxygenase PhyH